MGTNDWNYRALPSINMIQMLLFLCSWENIMLEDYAVRGIFQTFMIELLTYRTIKLLTNNWQFSLQLQRCLQKLIEDLRLKILRLLLLNYFRQTPHFRCLTGFWVHLSTLWKWYWYRFFFLSVLAKYFRAAFFPKYHKG